MGDDILGQDLRGDGVAVVERSMGDRGKEDNYLAQSSPQPKPIKPPHIIFVM